MSLPTQAVRASSADLSAARADQGGHVERGPSQHVAEVDRRNDRLTKPSLSSTLAVFLG